MLEVLTNQRIYEEVIQNGARRARHSLWIATANVKDFFLSFDDHTGSALELFEELAQKHVDIRILHSGIPSHVFLTDLRKRRDRLPPTFFKMRRCIRTHFKVVLVDSAKVYIGSANLTGAGIGMRSGGKRNFELGIISDQDVVMDPVADFFLNLWDGEACKSCRIRHICVIPLETPFEE